MKSITKFGLDIITYLSVFFAIVAIFGLVFPTEFGLTQTMKIVVLVVSIIITIVSVFSTTRLEKEQKQI